ncbi:hypothetical protein COY16_04570 [Candidatus Roizmanbacteria bacterium CG_4_10_14_0_2_um_filter_39_13]|uniref:Peptidase S8/S53 domain-containing protein n=1 Tax=Candidatus Roizmanbacteria bacterium CG_4_10_14_0_2_um_filter_39_13 TaxID=1974825 RepID=A0A2M7TX25_9BACT|nr:MAG: hypothetical protein COY16_04570 [Candidatus Roizmanbacteria bacterium CG_4_10_14_0_2_um_filter_39_13]
MKYFQAVVQILFSIFCLVSFSLLVVFPKGVFALDIDSTVPEVNIIDKNEPLYVPDSVIVHFKDEKTPEELAQKVTTRTQQKESFFGWVQVNVSNIGRAIRRDQTPETQLESIENTIDKNNLEGSEMMDLNKKGSLYVFEESSGKNIDVKKVINEFNNDPTVESAFPNAIIHGAYAPNDPAFADQWHYENITIPQAWDMSPGDTSGNVVVAVMDSGIQRNHQDLSGNILGWYDCTNGASSCQPNSGNDGFGHGTHVAGTVSAATNNNILVSGVGHNTKIISFKVLGDDNKGQLDWLIKGFHALEQQYPNKKIIVNMSLSFTVYIADFESFMNQRWIDGMVLVAAAGNAGDINKNYPAGFANVISVAATKRDNVIAPYSTRGSWVDVTAPGGSCSNQSNIGDCVLSTSNANWASYMQGTSMAAPHVSGVLALMWSVNPALSNQQIRDFLQNSSDRISGTGTYWKYGKINALAGVNSVLGTLSTPTPTYTQTPTPSDTPIPSNTPTNTPTFTPIPTATWTPIPTATFTPIPTATYTPVPTAMASVAPVLTGTPTNTPTDTPFNTPTNTSTPIASPTQSPQDTVAPDITQLPTATDSPDVTLPPACDLTTGDADCNGSVDSADYGCWVVEYLDPDAELVGDCKSADFNSSGKVDLLDFVLWRNTILSQG